MWRRPYTLLCLLPAVLILPTGLTCAGNPIQDENALAGTSNWQLTNPATQKEIEGYASLTSVNKGGQINLLVSSADANFTIEIYRIGWYGGTGSRKLLGPIQITGGRQPNPIPDPITGLAECNWTSSYALSIPSTWVSGVYLVKLTGTTSGKQAYITFVVRDDSRQATYLFNCSVTTYQAYNNWPGAAVGGKSLYTFNSAGGVPATKVGFNRPYAFDVGQGAGHFLNGGWECCMVRFMEREGYDVAYCSDIDVHENANLLLNHRAFLSVGHDEYWSWQMRTNVTAARDLGINLGFFGADTCYWQIRLEPSTVDGTLDRVEVGYKQAALTSDPYALDTDPTNDKYITRLWRFNPFTLPEEALIGIEYVYDPVNGDIVISDPTHWAAAGTNATAGQHLVGLLGYEVDGALQPTLRPYGVSVIAHSPIPNYSGAYPFSDMATYVAPSGATVFATGSIWWSWGLDDFGVPTIHSISRIDPTAQQITRNVLNRFASLPRNSNLIVNGSFETGDFTGWTATGNQKVGSATTTLPVRTVTDGTKCDIFNGGQTTPNGVLSQTFATVPGAIYLLSFDFAAYGYQTTLPEQIQVTVQGNGTILFSKLETINGQGTGTWWASRTYSFVANATSTTLTFTDASLNTFNTDILLDNVRVIGLAPPSLITNGGFESGYAGWTATGNQIVATANSNGAQLTTTEGTKAVAFNDLDRIPNGVLTQTFATTPGTTYSLTFDLAAYGFQSTLQQLLQVSVQDSLATLLSQIVPVTAQGTGTWWTPQAFTFIANTNSTTLTFTDVSIKTLSTDMLLDNVRVAIPMPNVRCYLVMDSNYVSLVYTKSSSATDLTYTTQESCDLMNWSAVTPINQILTDDGVTQMIKASVPRTDESGGKLFLRLLVSR